MDRKTALKVLKGDFTEVTLPDGKSHSDIFSEAFNMAIAALQEPEIVHCKDCKLRKTEECAMQYECDCGEQHSWENDNDYCSWGKRYEE